MKNYLLAVLLLAFAGFGFAQTPQSETAKYVQAANLIVAAINADNYQPLVKEYTKDNLDALPLFKTEIFFRNIVSQYGKIQSINSPKIVNSQHAIVTFFFERGIQDLKLYLDPAGKIDGFIFLSNTDNPKPENQPQVAQTPAPAPAPVQVVPTVPDKQKSELYPPFAGTWIVTSGGEPKEGAAARNLVTQQWSFEFMALVNNDSRKNDGKTNEDFFGFGKEILAPGDGIVTDVIDGVRDNEVGSGTNSYMPLGNVVVIQHRFNEYSVLGFLKQHSVKVKAGDKVTRGQVIGLAGNSGRSVEPGLHFHVQDSPVFQNARGLKFYFDKARVTLDGKTESTLIHLPAAGEVIAPE